MCATAALHPDEVRAWIGYTGVTTYEGLTIEGEMPPMPGLAALPAE